MEKMSRINIEDIKQEDYYKWDKDEFIKKKISRDRTNNWYKERYKRNLNIAITLSIMTVLSVIGSATVLKVKSSGVETYLTLTDGTVMKHESTKEENNQIKEAIKVIRTK